MKPAGQAATRDHQVPRAIQADGVWVNQYHSYPVHAPFEGYKQSGYEWENHKMMLDHYRQTKNMLVSYNKKKPPVFLPLPMNSNC